jgi:hypothetical protein
VYIHITHQITSDTSQDKRNVKGNILNLPNNAYQHDVASTGQIVSDIDMTPINLVDTEAETGYCGSISAET